LNEEVFANLAEARAVIERRSWSSCAADRPRGSAAPAALSPRRTHARSGRYRRRTILGDQRGQVTPHTIRSAPTRRSAISPRGIRGNLRRNARPAPQSRPYVDGPLASAFWR